MAIRSNDGLNWGAPVATGTFANDDSIKEVEFALVTGEFVRLHALSEVDGDPWTSLAELNVFATPQDTPPTPPEEMVDLSGTVQDAAGSGLCAMVLANGQFMFTCDGMGQYALNIPLDTNGQFKLQVYAEGFVLTI